MFPKEGASVPEIGLRGLKIWNLKKLSELTNYKNGWLENKAIGNMN